MRVFLPLRLQQQKNQRERQLFIEQQEQWSDRRNTTVEDQTEVPEKEDEKESSVTHSYIEKEFERKRSSEESEDDNQEESQTKEDRIRNSIGSEEESNHDHGGHEDTKIAVTYNSNEIVETGETTCSNRKKENGSHLESTPIRRVASTTNHFEHHCGSDKSQCLGFNPTESTLENSGSSTSKQQQSAADLRLLSALVSAEPSADKSCGVSATDCLSSYTYSSRGGAKKRKELEGGVSIKSDTIQTKSKRICSSAIDIELNQRKSLNADTTKEGNQGENFNSEEIPLNTLSALGKETSQHPFGPKAKPTLTNLEFSCQDKSSHLDADQVYSLLIKSSSLYSDREKKAPIQQPGRPKETSPIFVPLSSPNEIVTHAVSSSRALKVADSNTRKSPISHPDSKQSARSETNITLPLNSPGLSVSRGNSSTKASKTASRSKLNLNNSVTKSSMGLGKRLGDFYISQLQQKSDDGCVENDNNGTEEQSNSAMGLDVNNVVNIPRGSPEGRTHLDINALPIRDRKQFDLSLISASTSAISANAASSALQTIGHKSTLNSKPFSKHSQKKQLEFSEALKKRGLEEVEQEGDGNCLFRAVSLQVYGDSDAHMDVRRRCMDFMVSLWGSQIYESKFKSMHA